MGMRQLFTIAEFDRLVRQQAQRPPCTPSWRSATGQRGDFRPLLTVDHHGSPRPLLVGQSGRQSLRSVFLPPGTDRRIADAQGLGNGRHGLPPIQFEQCRRPLIRPGSQRAFLHQGLQIDSIRCGKAKVVFSHRR